MTDPRLSYFAQWIEKELGIIYSQENYFQLQNRLEEIVRTMKFNGIDELYSKVQEGAVGQLKQLLIDSATNNETSFFRDARLFTAIEQEIIPNLIKQKPGQKLRFWSAASSMGQEAYSLAMICDQFAKTNSTFDYEIFASDISAKALRRVEEATYSTLEVGRGLTPTQLQKHFTPVGDGNYRVNTNLRSRVKTGRVNLRESFRQVGTFDLILCRNVLIYQRVEAKKEIISRLTNQLESNGLLVMGAGESMIGISQDFEQKDAMGAIFYQLKSVFNKTA
ncbi:CheR family methyltransferase [Bdellovibrio reynosensis]|uniref:protein-glutamate O-methyltransferase n=1 Tax=Bdellovibrio reynosensis TaxID=2835041 RepID=A0ABY4C660_9BACT|nr:protein-glutamate O-methyltransferase CheR [Bdellovibrio reynosensis]UOF00189.1 protein-glutamate O-methyltransferase CheR [Bdellovibrio reynosensis]